MKSVDSKSSIKLIATVFIFASTAMASQAHATGTATFSALPAIKGSPGAISPAANPAAPPDPEVLQIYVEGIKAHEAGEGDKALKLFRKADGLGIDDPEMFFRMAEISDRAGRYLEAAKYYLVTADRFEKYDPENSLHGLAYSNLGAALMRLGKVKAAEAAFRKAKTLAPANELPLLNLATLYTNDGQYDLAVKCYNLSLLLEPDNPSVNLAMARCLAHAGRTMNAMNILDGLIERDPKSSEAVYNLGILNMQKGYYAKAQQLFHKAITLGIKDPAIHLNLGLIQQIFVRDNTRALAHYRKYLAMGGKASGLVEKMIKGLLEAEKAGTGGSGTASGEGQTAKGAGK